jgi:hypothetical protein
VKIQIFVLLFSYNTEYQDKYFGAEEMRMESGEGFSVKNFIVCTVYLFIIWMIKFIRLRWAEHVAIT